MMRSLVLVMAIIALTGCSTLKAEKTRACDGKHRRPANPYGSVLTPTAPPATTPAKPDKLSSVSPTTYRSCGA
jgi:hypothetical protein